MALILKLGERGKRLRASGSTDAGVRAPLSTPVTWNVSPPGIVTLSPTDAICGLRADGAGDCVVTATCGGITETYAVSVIAPTATRIVITAEDVP
jgi:hypothetical protein